MQKILPVLLWVPTTFLALIISMAVLLTIREASASPVSLSSQEIILTSYVLGSYNSNIISKDARPEIVSRFLERYQCPLKPYDTYGKLFVKAADQNGLDFRLLPAISMQESNCCKKMPDSSNNCWGFGIYGDQVLRFESIEQGINVVGKTLAKNYTSAGLMEPDEIMSKYTPSSKGTWAYGVLYFMNQMK